MEVQDLQYSLISSFFTVHSSYLFISRWRGEGVRGGMGSEGGEGDGVRGRFSILFVYYRGEWQLLRTFFGMKKYCFYPKLSHFEISKIDTITMLARILIAIP